MLTHEHLRSTIDTYIRAWVTQDPDLIVTIFTPEATYHERVLSEPIRTREGIREYWRTKVVESQANISCELLSAYIEGETAVAEWRAEFDDLAKGVRKCMQEVAILEFDDDLISSLREYWTSKVLSGNL